MDHSGDERDEDIDNEVVDQPPSESLTPQATDTPNQSPAEDGLAVMSKPQENNYHRVKPEVFPNPHMNSNFLVKLNIPRVIMCLTIACLNQISHL